MIEPREIRQAELNALLKKYQDKLGSNANILSDIKINGANLEEANLRGATISRSILYGAKLMRADLRNCDLHYSSFASANLTGANLYRAGLLGADFRSANLTGANLRDTNLRKVNFSGAILKGANLEMARLVETDLTGADLFGCRVYGIGVWDTIGEPKNQSNLIITPEGHPCAIVDHLQFAQLIYALQKNRAEIGKLLDTLQGKVVLILGHFKEGGLDTLSALADQLRAEGFVPCIIDFTPELKRIRDTVMVLAGLARFVVVDPSGDSVSGELANTVAKFIKTPFIPILERGREAYSLFKELQQDYPNVVDEIFYFKDHKELKEKVVSKIVTPALNMFR